MVIYEKWDGGELSTFSYYKNYFDHEYYNKILSWLETLNYYKGYKDNNKLIDREQIWYDNNNNYFCKKWKKFQERWMPHQYDEMLIDIQNNIINRTNIIVDTCLINKYKSGKDSISAHKDNNISFGNYPNILIYSLGCKREFQINSDTTKKSFIIELEPNSLLIMSGASQKYFTHEILKNKTDQNRYSLTFRKYIN